MNLETGGPGQLAHGVRGGPLNAERFKIQVKINLTHIEFAFGHSSVELFLVTVFKVY